MKSNQIDRAPIGAWLLAVLGIVSVLFGLALAAPGGEWPPLLAEPMAWIVFVVTGIALLGTAAFPMIFRRLADEDEQG